MTDTMSTMSNEELVAELIDAAENVGYEIGSDRSPKGAYARAKVEEKALRKAVLLRLQGTCGLACHTDKAI